jgi:uncharacterized membrane protein YccC
MPPADPSARLARLSAWLGLDPGAWQQALRLALAAWVAFAVAVLLQLDNPFWAAMPVWVVSQPLRGLLIERALFRVLGTLAGAAVGFYILQLPVHPYGQLATLGLWVAVCAGGLHLIRAVASYAVLMLGLTAAVVVLPAVLVPETGLQLAQSRVWCTLVGACSATLFTAFSTPAARRRDYYLQLTGLAARGLGFADTLLRQPGWTDDDALRQQLLETERQLMAELSVLDAQGAGITAGSLAGYRRLKHLDALLVALIGVLAEARVLCARDADAARALGESGALAALGTAMAEDGAPGASARALERVEGLLADDVSRLAVRLRQLFAARQALLAEGAQADAPAFAATARRGGAPREWALARDAGLLSGLATFLAGALAYRSGLVVAELAALGVCLFSMVLGSLPMPQRVAPGLFAGVLVGVVLATGYRLGVQPHLDGPAMLLASLLPFLVLGGFARVARRTAMPALDANMCFLLASQAGMPAAGMHEVLVGGGALTAGAAVVSAWFMLVPRRPGAQASRVRARIRADIERLLKLDDARLGGDWSARSARLVLRLALHLSRLPPEAARHGQRGALSPVSLGVALQGWRRHARQHPSDASARLHACIAAGSGDPPGLPDALDALGAAGQLDDDARVRAYAREIAEALRRCAGLWG